MFILPLCTTRLILVASVLFNLPTSMHVSVKVLMKLLVLQQLVTEEVLIKYTCTVLGGR